MPITYRSETCEVCYFSEPIKDVDFDVECRFNAPQCLHGSGSGWSDQKWPVMRNTEWCAEHREDLDVTTKPDWENWRVKK